MCALRWISTFAWFLRAYARKFYAPKWNRGNVWKNAGKRVKVEPPSTFTLMRGFHKFSLFIYKYAHKNYATVEIHPYQRF